MGYSLCRGRDTDPHRLGSGVAPDAAVFFALRPEKILMTAQLDEAREPDARQGHRYRLCRDLSYRAGERTADQGQMTNFRRLSRR